MAGFIPDWRNEFLSKSSTLEQLVSSSKSRLDEIIPPEFIIQLLRENKRAKNKEFSSARLVAGGIRRILRKSHILHKATLPFSTVSAKTIDHTTLFKRIFLLRLYLSKGEAA